MTLRIRTDVHQKHLELTHKTDKEEKNTKEKKTTRPDKYTCTTIIHAVKQSWRVPPPTHDPPTHDTRQTHLFLSLASGSPFEKAVSASGLRGGGLPRPHPRYMFPFPVPFPVPFLDSTPPASPFAARIDRSLVIAAGTLLRPSAAAARSSGGLDCGRG